LLCQFRSLRGSARANDWNLSCQFVGERPVPWVIARRGHAEAPTTKVASVQQVSGEIAQKISTNVVDAYSQSFATRATDLCGCVFGLFLSGIFSGEPPINRRVSGTLNDAGCAEALPHLFRKSDSSIAIFE